ncbi:VQ motif-containing protein 22-like [Olea europaea var. sylvestris]|uniref:VQ motif-containing protein 22-like n=1 Tax=Olea europaea var. sylvestris TaxID=158386 RepID=UPI000C1CDD5F|nr:VQ motif-containing protein 22-like [Olea europaea var. sylvestris]
MAISETMSNSTDWMHFYQHNFSGQPQNIPSFSGSVSESVTPATTTWATEVAQSNSSPSYSNLNMDGGRAARPLRRRPRASRRSPVVLLNTNTSNFRAMVQQFTGGPSSSLASRTQYSNGVNFGFGVGTQQSMIPSTAMAPNGFQIQFQRQQRQYPNQLQHIFTSLNNKTQGDASAFLHKFMPNTEVEPSSGFVKNGGSVHVPPSEGSGGRGGFHL